MLESVERFFKRKPQVNYSRELRELSGCHVAILSTDVFEVSELLRPK